MGSSIGLILFLVSVMVASIFWGRINRFGYTKFVSSIVHFSMKYLKVKAELIRSYLVWLIYLFFGLAATAVLLLAYQVNIFRLLDLDLKYITIIPLTFVAQNSLTGLMMGLLIVAKPGMDVFREIVGIPWVRFTLMLPSLMRVISPLGAAICEELFFRGAVFIVLINNFPQLGIILPILLCTVFFVVQQVIQTDGLWQGLILLIGSTSISIVGCIATLSTGSILPTLLCHATYAVFYLQLGTSMQKGNRETRTSKSKTDYPSF